MWSLLLACQSPNVDKHLDSNGAPPRDTAGTTDSSTTDSSTTDSSTTDSDPSDSGPSDSDTGQAPTAHPRFGAIRWDAWQEDGSVNAVVEQTLSPAHWHTRMPWFGVETGTDSVSIRGNDAAIMDAEIAYAAAAGVDYWAFVTYPPDEGMSNALDLYLDSPAHNDVGFALILQGGWLAVESDGDWASQTERYVSYFQDSAYVQVDGGRPLVYLFDAASMWGTSRFPDQAAAAAAFAELASASEAAGAGRPYFVLMGWDPAADAATATALGFDALSAYAVAGGADGGAPYADLRAQAVATWSAQAAQGLDVVPILGVGWDPRPRIETPTPWAVYANTWFNQPTPDEFAAHVTEGLSWMAAHPDAAPAGTVLAYAWNEHDEGGWLCPTWTEAGPDTARVDALAAALSAWDARLPLQNGSFEAPSVGYGWYIVPAGGLPSEFAWTSPAPEGSYLLADPIAAHFSAAADGGQALLLASAPSVEQAVPVAAGPVTLSVDLLTGTYPGDTQGEVRAEILQGGVVLAAATWMTPLSAGVWVESTLSADVAAGTVTVRLTSQSGMPWVDDVQLVSGSSP